MGDLSNINIEGFFGGIVDKVGNGIGGFEDGLTEAAIASQEVITGFGSGGVEVLGVLGSAVGEIIWDWWRLQVAWGVCKWPGGFCKWPIRWLTFIFSFFMAHQKSFFVNL